MDLCESTEDEQRRIDGLLDLSACNKLINIKLCLALLVKTKYEGGPYTKLADVLPRNVQHVFLNLEIASTMSNCLYISKITPILEDWLSDWKSVTPHLKKLELLLGWNPREQGAMRAHENVCRKSGVDFVINVYGTGIYSKSYDDDTAVYYSISNEPDGQVRSKFLPLTFFSGGRKGLRAASGMDCPLRDMGASSQPYLHPPLSLIC